MTRRPLVYLALGGTSLLMAVLLVSYNNRSHEPVGLAQEPPRVHFSTTERDLGEIALRAEGHEVAFPIANRGLSDLIIKRLILSCSCASAQPTRSVLKPGEEGAIRMRIKPRQPEEKSASVSVHTNDPVDSRVRLTVHWRAVGAVEFDPLTLDLGTVRPGATVERTVQIVRRDASHAGTPSTIEAMPRDRLTASLDGSTLRVRLTVPADDGDDRGRVTVRIDGGEPASISLPVRWHVRDVVEAVPKKLFLAFGRPSQEFRRQVVLTSEGETLKIVRTVLEGIPGQVTWRQIDRNRAVLDIHAALPDTAGPVVGKVVVECRSPEPRTLSVPVTAVVSNGEPVAGGAP